jgi:hypothetical protein
MIHVRFLALVLLASLTSCFTSVGKWTYPSGRYPTTQSDRPAPVTIVVERFVDLRSDTNRSGLPWGYVPLVPYCTFHYDRPEAVEQDEFPTQYQADPCEDLARSIAVELSRGRIVERAEYSPDGRRAAEQALVLRGRLRSFLVHESRWTYGISVYAVLLWGLGLPEGTSVNGFCVDLELVDERDERVVWQGTVFDSDHHVEGFYYGPEWYRFPWMWERRLREKLQGLATAVGAHPAPLPAGLSDELRRSPPVMPACPGVDSSRPCTQK